MPVSAAVSFTLAPSAPGSPLVVTTTVTSAGGLPGFTIPITGSGTYTVDLQWLPAAGAKALLVTLDTVDAGGAPVSTPVTVELTINSVVQSLPIMPGGGVGMLNPSPTSSTGVTAMQIVTTANAVVHVAVYG